MIEISNFYQNRELLNERACIMKKLMIFSLLVLLLFLLPTSPEEQHTQAATTQFVQAKNDILLRDAPNKDAKTISKIKNHSKVTVHSQKNGWAYVEQSGKKGYIYASTLTTKNPQAQVAPVFASISNASVTCFSPPFKVSRDFPRLYLSVVGELCLESAVSIAKA